MYSFVNHFKNRKDAGERLAGMLSDFKDKNAIVLGIPRGGVEIAYYVATTLNLEWSVVISKKLPYPGHEEYGFGAITEEDTYFVNQDRAVKLSHDVIKNVTGELKKEVQRRIDMYRGGEPLPEMQGKVAVIVDDGIATGVTLIPVIRLCRKHNAARIVIASPVSGKDFDKELKEADEIRVLFQPDVYSGVGQAYQDFSQLTDEDVMHFLRRNKNFNK